MTSLSIIVPTKNRYGTLFPVINALIRHIKESELEIIIQDNSDDNGPALEFMSQLNDGRVKYFYIPHSLPISDNTELAMDNGHTRTNVVMGIGTIISVVPLLLILIPKYGLVGAAIPWLVVNFSVTALLGYIIMRKFMNGEFKYWFWNDSLLPILVSFGIGIPLYFLFSLLLTGYYTLFYGVVIFIVVLCLNSWLFVCKFPETKTHPLYKRLINK